MKKKLEPIIQYGFKTFHFQEEFETWYKKYGWTNLLYILIPFLVLIAFALLFSEQWKLI